MNRFTKLALAATASLALAAPAQAENDAAKVVAGILGVALLGAAISELTDDDHHVTHVVNQPPSSQQHHVKPRPLPKTVLRYTLPKECVRPAGHSHGSDALLNKGCLNRNFAFADDLPKKCSVRYWSHKRSDVKKGYTLNCLERHGYRVSRR